VICILLNYFLFRWCYTSLLSFFFFFLPVCNICSCLSSMKNVEFYWHDWQPIQDWLLVCNICHVCCRQPMHYAGHILKLMT
jgi:hypothetical protein